MFNYYTNEKLKNYSQQLNNQKLSKQKFSQIKQKLDQKLIRRYIERSTHGHERMLEASRDINMVKEYHHQFRDFDKSKVIGPPNFYYKARDDQSRIKEAEKQNENLDQVPFCLTTNPSIHRFRHTTSKQNFKFTSYDTVSRVVQTVHGMKTNQVPSSWKFDIKKYLREKTKSKTKKNHSRSTSQRSNPKQIKQIILPNLNTKYYPKSLQSLKNSIEYGPLKHAIIQGKNQNKLRLLKKADLNIKFNTVHVNQFGIQSQDKDKEKDKDREA